MNGFLFLFTGIVLILLVLVAGVRPARADESLFELRRRQRLRDKRASDALRRQVLLTQAAVLSGPLRAALIVLLSALLMYLLGPAGGLICAVLIGILHGRAAQLTPVRKLINNVYTRSEPALLGFVSKHKKIIRLIGGRRTPEETIIPLGSKEELTHLIERSPIFSDEDKRLLESTLRFKERTVKELMTSRSKVVTVDDSELLGPLVLDDLHKTGHTIFPVVKDGAVVGLLDSSDHADLHTKESVHVRSVMHTDVVEIDEDVALDEALRTLLTAKEQLLIVVDDTAHMTGIVSLKDVVRALVG